MTDPTETTETKTPCKTPKVLTGVIADCVAALRAEEGPPVPT